MGGTGTNGQGAKVTSADPLRFFTPPVRTTAAQQTGLVPRLVEQVIPAHVPSHQLPPPSMIWERFLAVYGIPEPGSAASSANNLDADVAQAAPGAASEDH